MCGCGQSTGGATDASCCANWPLNTVRYFFLSKLTTASNNNIGYIDAPAGTVFTSAQANAVKKLTFADFRRILPPIGNGRMFVLLVEQGSDFSAEDWDWRGISGYAYFARRASDLTNSVTDRIQNGFANANGATVYTVDVAPTVSAWNVVGGGLVADAQVGFRFHFLSGTANGKVGSIVQNGVASVIPLQDISAGIAAGDTFIIERPSVKFRNSYEFDDAPVGVFPNSTNATILYPTVGIAWTGTRVYIGSINAGRFGATYVGCETLTTGAQIACSHNASIQIASSYLDETNTQRTVGSYFRTVNTINLLNAAYLQIDAIFDTGANATQSTFSGQRLLMLANGGYFKVGPRILDNSGGPPATAYPTGNLATSQPAVIGPSQGTTTRPVRIVGPSSNGFGLGLVYKSILAQFIDFANMGANPCVKVFGVGGQGVRLTSLTGTTGNTDVGIDLTECSDANIDLGRPAANTVSGGAGNIRVNGGQIQTHVNYTISSYRDNGGNFIQGSAQNTSYPAEMFCGRHIGDVGAVFEWMAKYNLLVGIAINYPSRARWYRGIKVQPTLNTQLAATTVTLFKNNVATAMTVSIPAGSNALVSDFTHPIQFADGDLLDLVVTSTGGVNNVFLAAFLEYT